MKIKMPEHSHTSSFDTDSHSVQIDVTNYKLKIKVVGQTVQP